MLISKILIFIILCLLNWNTVTAQTEPIRYIGEPKIADQQFHDGQLRPVIGVHSYQVLRANRTYPPETDKSGNCYNHAPMLAYWNNRYYLEYLASAWNEHGIPTQTYLTSSADGISWESPKLIFPAIEYENRKYTIAHQRMGFYVAPNNRLLVLAFYGIPTGPANSPNRGNGIGRAVREIYRDNSLGPIYFIREMAHAGYPVEKAEVFYPFFTQSPDTGFVNACYALLDNKLMTQQWWEEDRADDGFFALGENAEGFEAKALSFYHRKDRKTVGLWKDAWAAISEDNGESWSKPVKIKSKPTATAKEWGQKTDDEKYAIVYNPMPKNFYRYPLAIITSEDGETFDNMLVVQTEVPPLRYNGHSKDRGSNYVRGIAEGNGNPPGTKMPVVYSMNKEDIWISLVPTPITGITNKPVNDDFEHDKSLENWNIYSTQLARVSHSVAEGHNLVLKFTDNDPHDYAKAVRVFPESEQGSINFKLNLETMGKGRFEIDITDRYGNRAVKLQYDNIYRLCWASNGNDKYRMPKYEINQWTHISIKLNAKKQTYNLLINDEIILEDAMFYQEAKSLERIEFRTGFYRREVQYGHIHQPESGPVFSAPDEKFPGCTVLIDDVIITTK
jgi:hypothetical protein